ncbi:MAG: hypothetical protein LKI46_05170 [Prevotella sp.]|jgi:hypothetical protein|nr:hypothetical protein [Prevotella sp.]MCI1685135.1 hypothetical protein [Prevotella sp.]MCI2179393.1 hypothetical protein [Prevotella sp.]
MRKIILDQVNYGDHYVEKKYCDLIKTFNGGEIELLDHLMILISFKDKLIFKIDFMEEDILTKTWKSHYSDQTEFRIVRPKFPIQIVTIASMYHDGYAVTFNLI